MKISALLLLSTALVSCGPTSKPAETASSESSAELPATPVESPEEPAPAEPGAVEPATPTCVSACVESRRAEAQSAEAIEADCKGRCDCVDACVEENQMRAEGPDKIRWDCEEICTQ